MNQLAFAMGGPADIAIIAAVVLLLFGGSKLAGFGKSLGKGIKEFKEEIKDEQMVTSEPSAASGSAAGAKPEEATTKA